VVLRTEEEKEGNAGSGSKVSAHGTKKEAQKSLKKREVRKLHENNTHLSIGLRWSFWERSPFCVFRSPPPPLCANAVC
jgi:hypothetical protein